MGYLIGGAGPDADEKKKIVASGKSKVKELSDAQLKRMRAQAIKEYQGLRITRWQERLLLTLLMVLLAINTSGITNLLMQKPLPYLVRYLSGG